MSDGPVGRRDPGAPGGHRPEPAAVGRLREAFEAVGAPGAGDTLVVAVSGGRDSVALLHLLRFTSGLPPAHLVAAHLDHGMRPGSADDGAWVRGLCRAWDVPLHLGRLSEPPGDEAAARRARYAFLEEVRASRDGAAVLTAHHADDQAETVLFRVLRGTGPRGLRGILPRRGGRVWRPLLASTRAELAAYAAAVGLAWRPDPTNRLPYPRNVLRHEILPRVEEAVAPGAREAVAGLARRARDEEAAWTSLLPGLLEPLDLQVEDEGLSFLRRPLLDHHPAVQARLLRALALRMGSTPTDAGTRSAVTFISAGASGTGIDLPGGVELRRALDRLLLLRRRSPGPDRPLEIPSAAPGGGEAVIGGRRWALRWGRREAGGEHAAFAADQLRFPLRVRGWSSGDRMRFPYGRKKLKKIFLEARIPARERHRRPVVADAEGRILWVPGIARSSTAAEAGAETILHIGCTDAHTD